MYHISQTIAATGIKGLVDRMIEERNDDADHPQSWVTDDPQVEEYMAEEAYYDQQAMQEGMSAPEGEWISSSSLPPEGCPF